jgi:hypothetical protein
MQNENANEPTTAKGPPPSHRLWMVADRESADPDWTELATLWPTKKGTGFTGRLEKARVFLQEFAW